VILLYDAFKVIRSFIPLAVRSYRELFLTARARVRVTSRRKADYRSPEITCHNNDRAITVTCLLSRYISGCC